ncbi:hypothetical protein [Kitasatospora sp. NPDC089509]|uniref:hypothetical protein n=1 Tax=Kitasatospora sp. NPDC089509 TaxID=3364079 RepID=UPI0037F985AD
MLRGSGRLAGWVGRAVTSAGELGRVGEFGRIRAARHIGAVTRVGEIVQACAVVQVGAVARTAFGVSVRPFVAALVGLPVDRVEVRMDAVFPGACARTAGRVRSDRSGRLKTSHGSRLFKGEGPTGEDNAARAAGPLTG